MHFIGDNETNVKAIKDNIQTRAITCIFMGF